MKKNIFREYDIRGKVGTDLPVEEVYRLGRSLAAFVLLKNPSARRIMVGMDGRLHSLDIKEALCKALIDSGLHVIFIGICPTPVLYFSMHVSLPDREQLPDAGFMITASHNGAEYNGIKMMLGTHTIWGKHIQEIYTLYTQEARVHTENEGGYSEQSYNERYIQWLVNHFSHLKGYGNRVLFDCANGATAVIIPALITALGWENSKVLYGELDGTFPHHEPDPVVLEHMTTMRTLLETTDMQVGIGFDGDGDRMAPMTKDGFLVPGDHVLALLSKEVIHQYPGAAVVFDVKCSQFVPALVTEWGGQPRMVAVGHALIKDALMRYQALIGGELSCHFFFKDRYFGYDDGIYAALRLIELMIYSEKSLEELVAQLPKLYTSREARIVCSEKVKDRILAGFDNYFGAKKGTALLRIDGIRATTEYGWALVRSSNTQSVISVRCESQTLEGFMQIKQDILQVLGEYFEDDALKEFIHKEKE